MSQTSNGGVSIGPSLHRYIACSSFLFLSTCSECLFSLILGFLGKVAMAYSVHFQRSNFSVISHKVTLEHQDSFSSSVRLPSWQQERDLILMNVIWCYVCFVFLQLSVSIHLVSIIISVIMLGDIWKIRSKDVSLNGGFFPHVFWGKYKLLNGQSIWSTYESIFYTHYIWVLSSSAD